MWYWNSEQWTAITLPATRSVRSITVDPMNPDRWIATDDALSIWQTDDGGITWKEIPCEALH